MYINALSMFNLYKSLIYQWLCHMCRGLIKTKTKPTSNVQVLKHSEQVVLLFNPNINAFFAISTNDRSTCKGREQTMCLTQPILNLFAETLNQNQHTGFQVCCHLKNKVGQMKKTNRYFPHELYISFYNNVRNK